ncbi:MAG: hypothetical protein ACKVQJ_12545 [Pyrinomonadaceae bacterium]
MFIVKALDDGTAEKFETLEQVYMECEGIDVNDGVYEFSDEEGNSYDVEWTEKVESTKWFGFLTTLTQGRHNLVKRNK